MEIFVVVIGFFFNCLVCLVVFVVLLLFVLNHRLNLSIPLSLKITTAAHSPSPWPTCPHAFFFLFCTTAQLQKEGLFMLNAIAAHNSTGHKSLHPPILETYSC